MGASAEASIIRYSPVDCNANGVRDDLEIAAGTSFDCNSNSVPDDCDLSGGTSADCNSNSLPDECEEDCNTNGVPDECDLAFESCSDCNDDGVLDECADVSFDLADHAAIMVCMGSSDPACLDAFDIAPPCGLVTVADFLIFIDCSPALVSCRLGGLVRCGVLGCPTATPARVRSEP